MGLFCNIFLFLFLLLAGSSQLSAQFFNPKCRYTSFGFSVKASYFDGDIETPLQYVRPGVGVSLNRRVAPRITLGSELMIVRVMGDDFASSNLVTPNKIPYYIRNLHFRNDIKEWSFVVKYDLFPTIDHYRKRPIYNLYGSVGLGIFHHNPKAKIFTDTVNYDATQWVSLQPLKTENREYSNFQVSIPLAVGIRYKLSLQWDVEVELGYRLTFTDYLDDVSRNYPDPAALEISEARMMSFRSADPKSALRETPRDVIKIRDDLGYPVHDGGEYNYVEGYGPGAQRGSKKGNDGIVLFNIRLLYAIPGKVNCPKFRDLY